MVSGLFKQAQSLGLGPVVLLKRGLIPELALGVGLNGIKLLA